MIKATWLTILAEGLSLPFSGLSSFRFIYFPHCLINNAFSYNFAAADSKKIRVCWRINARSRKKRVLEATLGSYLKHGNFKHFKGTGGFATASQVHIGISDGSWKAYYRRV